MKINEWIAHNILRMKQTPISTIGISREAETWGVEPTPSNYGNYYAQNVPIYAAIRLRAESILRPPLVVYQQVKDELKPTEKTHPLSELLRRVNPFWTASDLWRATSTYLDLWGTCYWLLTASDRKPKGEKEAPSELWPIRPDHMRVMADKKKYIRGFTYTEEGRDIPLRPDEVVWFRHFNPLDELAGLAPIAPLRLSADMGMDALRSNRNLFKRGILMNNVMFSLPDGTGDPEIADFERRLEKRFSGASNAHRPLVAAKSFEAKTLGLNPKDMEHLTTLRWTLEDVCRVYGVPKTLLHDLTNATYSNVDAEERIFWRNTIAPYLMFLEQEVNEMLVTQFGPDLVIDFDLSQIESMQEDANKLWERERANVAAGLKLINEVREQMGLSAVPWGDTWWAPMTLVPISDANSGLSALPEATAPKMADFSANGHRRYTPPALTDHFLDNAADIHAKRLDRHEIRFGEAQTKLFREQERDVLKRLQAEKVLTKQFGDLFNIADWLKKFVFIGRPLYLAAVKDSADAQAAEFGLGVAFDVANPLVQDYIVARTAFWANRVNEETAKLLTQELTEAYQAGESIREIQGRVEKVFRFNESFRSERIARTEMLSATNKGALELYRQSGVVESKMWLATVDSRTRQHHLDAHRQMVPLEAQFLVGGELIDGPGDGSPENVINCILPGNRVMAAGISAASIVKYAGPALELRTQGGRILPITPNHPILTWEGWKSAQEIRPGDYLVCGFLQQRIMSPYQNINQMPPRIEDIFGALDMIMRSGYSRPSAELQFHGDGRYMDGNIHIIGTEGQLWCTCQTPGLEPIHHHSFHGSDVLQSGLSGFSAANSFIPSALHSPDSIVGSSRNALTLSNISMSHAGVHGGTSPTRLDIMFQQAAANDCAAHAISQSEGFFGLAANVMLDKVIDIRYFDFAGHVYDLQSVYGSLYITNGVVVHNCRCSVAPVIGSHKRLPTPPLALTAPKKHKVSKKITRDAQGLPTGVEEVYEDA